MKRLFLAPLFLAIGLAPSVKAEPEWVREWSQRGGYREYDAFYDKNSFLLTNDGITIWAQKYKEKSFDE